IMDLLSRLQALSDIYDDEFDPPQLQLFRKFKQLRWVKNEQVTMSIDEGNIKLECRAKGFPCPEVQWYTNSSKEPVHVGKIKNVEFGSATISE
uniref:Ig-like domain-containing protein n=1 Tax=Caenorhabditis japonica TaxID=281687 RepID=A0A8R1HVZ7_CAEJA